MNIRDNHDLFSEHRATAEFSDCGRYRYTLSRVWDASRPAMNFLMLNPSTATESTLDPTCAKCQKYAIAWGFGGMWVTNCFAVRSTDPRALYKIDDPIGVENDAAIIRVAEHCELTVCAWGLHGAHLNRGRDVYELLIQNGVTPHALKLTADKHPNHPLYLKDSLKPFPFECPPLPRIKKKISS